MAFPTTHWSALAKATLHGESRAKEALEELCRRYWPPIFQFIRSRGFSASEAEDLTQEFIIHVIERSLFTRADPLRGQFRSFLLGSLVRFLGDAADRQNARKRGGTVQHLSLDSQEDFQHNLPLAPAAAVTLFDREWAMAVLETALARMRSDYTASGRAQHFACLKDFLPGGAGTASYETAAHQVGLSLAAFKSEVHRLRLRLRELIRAEVAQTVSAPHEIEAEIAHLGRVLMDKGSQLLPGTGTFC
jgi:RNA polymerase sigma-70 factor (ECF subfamily)